MNLSSALEKLQPSDRLNRQLSPKEREALALIRDVIKMYVDIEEVDEDYENFKPLCQFCNGNGCGSCDYNGDMVF